MVKLLVVDDEEDVCQFVKSFFENRRLKVFTALNGKDALDIVKRESPNIALIDVKMPGIDGITLFRKIKELDVQMDTIMVSAVDSMQVIEKAKALGAKQYITKPLVLEELEEVVLTKAKEWERNQNKA